MLSLTFNTISDIAVATDLPVAAVGVHALVEGPEEAAVVLVAGSVVVVNTSRG